VNEVWPPDATTGPLVKLTNPDKVLYPATGTTKAEVFRYYTTIAEVMLPYIAGRPATRKRWPDGVDEPSFFEKSLAKSAPQWLTRGIQVRGCSFACGPVPSIAERVTIGCPVALTLKGMPSRLSHSICFVLVLRPVRRAI
jgi:bifunctional non-homologous end joining protein LigD